MIRVDDKIKKGKHMDTRIMKYFLEIAREGNITKAAENLHISQPTLSRQLLDLEESLGVALFDRSHKQMTLTPSGLLFQQRAREILSLMEKTERDLKADEDDYHGVVSIGCVESKAFLYLKNRMMEFSRAHPHVKYELYSAGDGDLREKLDRGELDVAILLEPVEVSKYDYEHLYLKEHWGIVLREDHPLAQKQVLHKKDIVGLPLIIPGSNYDPEWTLRLLGLSRDELNVVASQNLPTNSVLLVQDGFGSALFIEGAYETHQLDGICFRRLEPAIVSDHVLAWKKDRYFTKTTAYFLQYLREYNHSI